MAAKTTYSLAEKEKKMKIALICTEKLPVPPISGGAVQLYIEGILPELSKFHDITVFSVDHPKLQSEEIKNNVKFIRVSGKSRVEYIRNVKAKLNDNYDLIHIFNRLRFVLTLSRDLPYTKFSLSLHNEMFEPDKIPIVSAIECVNKVEFISTVSNFIARGVVEHYPLAAKKIHTVYSGVNTEIYKPVISEDGTELKKELKKKYGIENKKVVLFVGRLSIKKGVDKLLLAMKKVMELRNDAALVVIGSKWYGQNSADEYTVSIEELSKTLKGPIIFTGFIPPSEVPKHYNLGDVFVCPSQWNEPLARVHYEAMAAGLPIITTNRGGNSEVINGYGNGIVIDDYTNVDAFAGQILELFNNTEKAYEMGEKGRKLAETKYSWARVANDLLKLFNGVEERMLNENSKPSKEKKDTFNSPVESSVEFIEPNKINMDRNSISDEETVEKIENLVDESIDEPVEEIIKKVNDLTKNKPVDFSKFKPIEYIMKKQHSMKKAFKKAKKKKYKQPKFKPFYIPNENNNENFSKNVSANTEINTTENNRKESNFRYQDLTKEEEYYLNLFENHLD